MLDKFLLFYVYLNGIGQLFFITNLLYTNVKFSCRLKTL